MCRRKQQKNLNGIGKIEIGSVSSNDGFMVDVFHRVFKQLLTTQHYFKNVTHLCLRQVLKGEKLLSDG